MKFKQLGRSNKTILRWVGGAIGVAVLLDLLTFLLAEGFWFQEVNYVQVFSTRLFTQGCIGLVVFAVSLGVLWWNLTLAQRWAWGKPTAEQVAAIDAESRSRLTFPGHMEVRQLLPLVLLGSFMVAASLAYYGQVAISHWRPQLGLRTANLPVPLKFDHQVVWELLRSWQAQPWQLIGVAALMVLLLISPQLMLRAIAVLVSLSFALVLSEHWDKVLLGLHRLPWQQTDPIFQTDIGFFIFSLPVWELLAFWLVGLAVLTSLSVGLVYLLSGDSFNQGYFPGFSIPQFRHLCRLGGGLMLVVSISYWINRYLLLYSPQGATYGAGYTSVTISLPAYTALSLLALPIALWLLAQGFGLGGRIIEQHRHPVGNRLGDGRSYSAAGAPSSVDSSLKRRWPNWRKDNSSVQASVQAKYTLDNAGPDAPPHHNLVSPSLKRRYLRLPERISYPPSLRRVVLVIGFYLLLLLLLSGILPVAVQQMVVQPNELQLEMPYIRRTLALTRQSFMLDQMDVQTFAPDNSLSLATLQENNLTVDNIRLWDKRPLLETNRQLQRIRLYYEFPDADYDRYELPTDDGRAVQQQVLIAARELDYNAVPTAAQTWINQHLIYTHGYGFTLSAVNSVGEGGLPDYLISGIESAASDPRLRNSIPVGRPRIYYGELTNTYVMTQTQVLELDYASGSDNVYNTYDGWGGVSIGNVAQRLLYAKHLRDWRMMFTDNFTPQTKLLFRRNISERVKAIAPFLRFDSDPYLVVIDTGSKQWQHSYRPQPGIVDESHLYWIIDAYTTSNRYPYSDPLGNDFNYIRNSVKVVIDAYHGSVNFYIADPQDPIIQAWSQAFPGIFQPLDAMPTGLLRHIRYPQDFYQVQSNQLMTYHMTDPIVFYNREDQWRAPNEIYGNEQQLVEPYYLIMKLPIGDNEEFILLRPFTPAQRNNLIAWLAARSDREQYGKTLLYVFPKQELVFGLEQIEARINQDPVISERISLWNRQGSRVVQGNLLVIPIERSLLYVEPIYLVAEQTQLPTLVRVIVAYGSRIAMAETLNGALNAIFTAPPTETPILRTTEEVPLP